MPQIPEHKVYNQRKEDLKKAKKRLKILITIGFLFLILFSIVLFASFKKGGFSNLTSGDQDIVSNTIKNIGTSFVEDKEQEANNKKYITPVSLPEPTNQAEKQAEKLQSSVAINNFENEYSVTVKKGSLVFFINQTNTRLGFLFSDGRDLKLNTNQEQNFYFATAGTYTFYDQLDETQNRITGTIRVID